MQSPPRAFDLEAEAAHERCGALRDYWYVACLAGELGRDRPLARTVLGVPLVLFRGPDGQAAAALDRCLHRNAALSAGVVQGGKLCCPYHGWVYDTGGRCIEIPSLGPTQRGRRVDDEGHPGAAPLPLTPADAGCLPTWPAREQDGLVFVYPGGDPGGCRRPPFRTPYYDDPTFCVYYMVTRFPNGVTNLAENFMDVPHTTVVHRGWFRNRRRREVPARVERRADGVLVTYEQEQDRIAGLGRLLNPTGAPMVHTDHFYAPNVTRVDYGFGARAAFVITSQCTPIGPLDSLVYTAIGYRLPADLSGAAAARLIRPVMAWYTRRVITQDVAIMRVQSRGLTHAPGGGSFRGTEADLIAAYIESGRLWLLAGADPARAPPAEDRRITFWI